MASNKQNGHPLCVAEAKRFESPVMSWVKILQSTQVYGDEVCEGFTHNEWIGEIISHMSNTVESEKADISRMWRCDCEETPEEEWSPQQRGRCQTLGITGRAPKKGVTVKLPSFAADLPTNDAEWDHLTDTVVRANYMVDEVSYMGFDASAQRTGLADPHFKFARELAWKSCRQDGNTKPVGKLLEKLPGTASLQNDGQYCGTILNAQAKSFSGTITEQLAEPLGGVSAEEKRASGSINVARNGKLLISGPIQALNCPENFAGGSEVLTLKLDGTIIQTIQSAPYLRNPLEIDLVTALETAHPGNTAQLTQAVLTVERTGTPCDGFWGSNQSALLTLTLNMPLPKIAFIRNDIGGSHIYVVNSDGSELTQLTSGSVTDQHPTWSPDRKHIAFSRMGTGTSNVYVINSEGSGLTQLTSTTTFSLSGNTYNSFKDGPSWSPDGTRIAFTCKDAAWDICVMNADGGSETHITNGATNYDGSSWSPDSSKIAFTRLDVNVSDWNVYIMNANGSSITLITNGIGFAFGDAGQSWSPDGTRIVFSRQGNIYIMNADGSGRVQLTQGSRPIWSPDGKRIAFSSGTGDISLMNADGSGVISLNVDGYYPAW